MAKRVPRATVEVDAAGERRAGPAPLPMDRIIGHERALGVLRGALKAGRLHHAWIFAGPPGVGKFTTALAFAAALLTPPGADGERIGGLLRSGTHPDLHVVRKELTRNVADKDVQKQKQSTIPIDVVREFVIEPASRTRVIAADSAAAKVFVIDEAELLAAAGQNALLKTLEEPPAGTVIILVTSSEEELSATIRSRSQRVAFTPLSDADFAEWLRTSRLLDGVDLGAGGEAFLRRFAAGAPGVAELAVRTGLITWWPTVGPALADLDAGRFRPGIGQAIADLTEAWAKARVGEDDRASKDAANHAAARWMFRMIADHYRGRLREAPGGPGARPDSALRAIDLVRDAERQAEASVQLPFVFECLAAQLAGGGSSGVPTRSVRSETLTPRR